MNWRAHLVIGLILCAILFYLLGTGIFDLLIFSLFGGLCALAPDLDHDMSKGRKIMDAVAILLSLILAYFASGGTILSMLIIFLALVGLYFVLFKLFKPKHRGITHTLVACFGFSVLIFFLAGKMFAIAGFIGYLSHLIADRQIKVI